MITCKYILTEALAGFIIVGTVIHHSDEQYHIHPEQYKLTNQYEYNKYTAVVSGTLISETLPDNVDDLGASPLNKNERIFGIK